MNGSAVLEAALIVVILRICLLISLTSGLDNRKNSFPSETNDFESFMAKFKFTGL